MVRCNLPKSTKILGRFFFVFSFRIFSVLGFFHVCTFLIFFFILYDIVCFSIFYWLVFRFTKYSSLLFFFVFARWAIFCWLFLFSFSSEDDNKLNNKNTFHSNVKVSAVWPVTQNTHYVINANCTEIFWFCYTPKRADIIVFPLVLKLK